jgi:decaprenylphospho-beta-D-erythro-pentofuranosid-2-ulose 2-reductase
MASVLILGASSDMAVATARKFASDKYDVILAARDTAFLDTLQKDIEIRYGVKCTSAKFDAMNFPSHTAFYQNLSVKPDVTVCVFGYMGDNEKAIEDWNETAKVLATNFAGAVSILNIIAKDYEAKKQGTIVGISSVAGLRGRQSNFIYGSAKAGFTTYLSGLRNYLFKAGVHVVTVLPGFVYTKMTAELNLPALLTAKPEDVAMVIKKAVDKKQNIVYVKWFWRWIMLVIKCIPEFVFKKLKL